MAKRFSGVVNIDVTKSVPDWGPYTQPIAPEGTPSVLYIVLDDVGYSAMGPYGGLIETPNIDRIAQRGLTYTNFHTTALCSPTRSCLMTGRNHTTNGMATITEAASGFPSSNGHIPFECGSESSGGRHLKLSVKFYLTAILFVVFDIESVFIYPWGSLLREFNAQGLGWFTYCEMLSFMATLALGLVYVWRKGALDWR